jgi:hypothetical protein
MYLSFDSFGNSSVELQNPEECDATKLIVVLQLAKHRLLRPFKNSFNSKSLRGLAMTGLAFQVFI